MMLFLLLVMLASCAAVPQDLTNKMFTFPQQTNTAHVRLTTSRQNLKAVSVCVRSFTDLRRGHPLFSLASPSVFNDFLIYKTDTSDVLSLFVRNSRADVAGQDYKINAWQSVCATWNSVSGVMQLWLNGQPSTRKFVNSGSNISGPVIVVLGQDQDSYGGRFVAAESFVGMMSDVHMWDYVISPDEILSYSDQLFFTPGNVLNWSALDFQIAGRVLLEDRQI